MPLYEYKCSDCKKVHEVIQKFADAPLQDCPDCQGALTKLMSMSSFSLKGTGWYTTDYKRSSAPAEAVSSGTDTAGTPAAGASDSSGTSDGKIPVGTSAFSESKESKESKGSKESKEPKESKNSKEPKEPKSGVKSATPPAPASPATSKVKALA